MPVERRTGSDSRWGTTGELQHLRMLVDGSYLVHSPHVREITVVEHLERYIAGMRKRIEWGTLEGIDGWRCIAQAQRLIKHLTPFKENQSDQNALSAQAHLDLELWSKQ